MKPHHLLMGHALVITALFTTSATTVAQGLTWTQEAPTTSPTARQGHAMVHDSVRQRTILFGGIANQSGSAASLADTWEWNGTDWTLRAPAASPTPRNQHNMVFDTARGRIVLFGGRNGGTLLGDTWEWNGTNWTQVTTATTPSARYAHAMAYDRARSRVVLFGGLEATTRSTQTWEYDGVNWTLRTTALAPTASQTAMAFHEGLAKTILFGGFDGTSHSNQTWQWDGTAWSLLPTPVAPAARTVQHLAYDSLRQRIVLFGGTNNFEGTTHFGDQWEHDGAGWVLRTPSRLPSARWQHALCFNGSANRIELFGGTTNWRVGSLGDTQTMVVPATQLSWSELLPSSRPGVRQWFAMTSDTHRNVVVLHGGSPGGTETWEWDGFNWLTRTSQASPTERERHAMAFDSFRRRTVLFGGLSSNFSIRNDTWEWDGTNWLVRLSANVPPPRLHHAMAFDSNRRRIILFGGSQGLGGGALGDTWEWDGTNWQDRTVQNGPAPRYWHSVAFDSRRGKTVLHGGIPTPDTWEWDGLNWVQAASNAVPPQRYGASIAYDDLAGEVIVFGGVAFSGGLLDDTWAWDGVDWRQLALAINPPARHFSNMAFEVSRRRIVVFGGASANSGLLQDTWALGPVYSAPILQAFGTGCGTQPLTLEALNARGPVYASQFVTKVRNVPQGLAFMSLGVSNTTVGPLFLPFDLAGFGGTGGCMLYHDTAIELAAACAPAGSGEATHTFTVPNLPAITGLPIYLQAWAPDSTFNLLGLVTSNALRTTVGNN